MVTINVMAMTSVVWMVMSVSVVIPVYRQGKFKSKLCINVQTFLHRSCNQ